MQHLDLCVSPGPALQLVLHHAFTYMRELYVMEISFCMCTVPLPHLVFGPLLNETYVGAVTYLYCTVQLGTAVDSAVQVNMSITRDNSDDSNQERNSDTVVELDNNQFQSSIVFMPLVHEDEDNYTCNVTVESNSESILATAVQGTYSLVPLGMD